MKLKMDKIVLFIIALLVVSELAWAEPFSFLNNKGNKFYLKDEYQKALELYKKAEVENPKSPIISYNLGNVKHQQKHFEQSEKYYHRALENTDKRQLADTHYNLGNNCFRQNQIEKAIESYQRCLELNPNDLEAKYNIELIKRMKQQNQKSEREKLQQEKEQKREKKDQEKEEKEKQAEQKSEQQSEKQKQQQEQKSTQAQPKMSKEEAERILSAIKEQEKELLKKQKRFGEVKPEKVGKDW